MNGHLARQFRDAFDQRDTRPMAAMYTAVVTNVVNGAAADGGPRITINLNGDSVTCQYGGRSTADAPPVGASVLVLVAGSAPVIVSQLFGAAPS